ncbi:MAG: VIT family protein [Proteobacteria bacterium]|nr:VIT family protein [Pseudomonadota bacterium]
MKPPRRRHAEQHYIHRIGWLRAAVLGANDGLLSTSSLLIGVAFASSSPRQILLAGVAGLMAGALSMAAGEYVSVSSQADTEKADLAKEEAELKSNYGAEVRELAAIYERRGLDKNLAQQVAEKLMTHDALEAHARDELGISEAVKARPVQAALASAASFAFGAALPLLVALIAPAGVAGYAVGVSSLAGLAVLGGLGARTGGANLWTGMLRVVLWGAVAMAVTAGAGMAFGARA